MMEARPTSERKQLHVPHDELEKDLTIEDRSPRHNGLLSGTEKPGDDETARRNSKTPIPQPSTRSNDAPFENGPPSLPFSLRDHGFPITVFCLLIATEFCFIPLSLYYGLTFRTKLNHRAVFSIITCLFGSVSGYEYTLRGLQLVRASPRYRPLSNSPRYAFDAVHILLGLVYITMNGIMIAGCIPHEPLVRLLSSPFAISLVILGAVLVWSAMMHSMGWKTPVRLSSTASGEKCPPVVYAVIEDVVGVDGRGGAEYRLALRKRWEASPQFRRLLTQLTWFWGLGAVLVGGAVLVLIFVDAMPEKVSYGIGWGVPSLWVAIWAAITTSWVRRALKEEKLKWRRDDGVPI